MWSGLGGWGRRANASWWVGTPIATGLHVNVPCDHNESCECTQWFNERVNVPCDHDESYDCNQIMVELTCESPMPCDHNDSCECNLAIVRWINTSACGLLLHFPQEFCGERSSSPRNEDAEIQHSTGIGNDPGWSWPLRIGWRRHQSPGGFRLRAVSVVFR